MSWVPDLFKSIGTNARKLGLTSIGHPSQLYAHDTCFASMEVTLGEQEEFSVTLVFFQDPNGLIRWGGFENSSSSYRETWNTEFFIKEPIAIAKRRTPLAVAAGNNSFEPTKVCFLLMSLPNLS